jgi:hypothetical protein
VTRDTEGGSKGQRKSPEQRQRPPRLREGAARGKNVAGAEAEAAEVAGGGSKGQRKSPEQRPTVVAARTRGQRFNCGCAYIYITENWFYVAAHPLDRVQR